jgi:hypothetical protein
VVAVVSTPQSCSSSSSWGEGCWPDATSCPGRESRCEHRSDRARRISGFHGSKL